MTLRSTRLGSLAAACALGISLVAVGQVPAHAAGTAIHDIDGDGVADLAIGRPGFDNDAGAVELVLSRGTQQLLTASDLGGTSEAGALFGLSVLVRDFDSDGFADIAIGAPHDVSSDHNGYAGQVFVVHGSATGADLTRASSLTTGEVDDQFGWSLAALGSASAPTALVVGAPLYQGGDPTFGGGVIVHPIIAGVIEVGIEFTQNTAGVPGASEDGDSFGYALDASGQTLIVGAPYEAIGTATAAGSVTLLNVATNGQTISSSKSIHQNTTGIPESVSSNDYFGASVAALGNLYAVGAPGEDIGTVVNTGLVQPFTYTAGGSVSAKPAIHQNVTGVPGANEKNDYFGDSVDLIRPIAGGRAVIVGTPRRTSVPSSTPVRPPLFGWTGRPSRPS
ncbi:MAG: VCBS repeat-containing protein [Micropruina sp.]|nr:VCBS repeat-containing protein [Micropruina sp.]